ncbi:MAG: putative toxin-antitoxin system toxin component, PIN family [Anaerolineae bacterium CG2_30_64_16]|nr:MAG: putative toxin-antitoxin system toxin component, PIN family [Anaerolineae bacterium CG2_30_64_16]
MTEPVAAEVILVVFDTNALLPFLVGKTRRALFLQQAWQDRRFVLAVTPLIIEELTRVMHYPDVRRKLGLTASDVDEALADLRQRVCNLPGLYEGVAAVQDDLSDNVFLACALEAGADYLVTRDAHLLSLKYYHGTQIVSLDQFARMLGWEC